MKHTFKLVPIQEVEGGEGLVNQMLMYRLYAGRSFLCGLIDWTTFSDVDLRTRLENGETVEIDIEVIG